MYSFRTAPATGSNVTTTRLKILCFAVAAWMLAGVAAAHEPLTDEQLDAITAGADDAVLEEITVHVARVTASGKRITADGTLGVQQTPNGLDAADLLLRDSAQSNLRALVNMNAVNSVVNVLVNLNINIDSQVGDLRQINLATPAGN
jgi:hypothetical protein